MLKGLTTAEANKLLAEFGPNQIAEKESSSVTRELLQELLSVLNMLLILAVIVSFFIGDTTNGFLILAIIFLNTAISFWQGYKAEHTLAELKKMTSSQVRVVRNGKEIYFDSSKLVPGDIVILESGDKVPADGVLIDAVNLEVNESALTGESAAVFKKPDEPEHNQVYAGTVVAGGRAQVKLTATGMKTRFGKIAQTLTQLPETDTPLQRDIKNLVVKIGMIGIAASALIYFAGIRLGFVESEMLLIAISSAVAVVPEALPGIIFITLAIGVKRMAQKKAIVRKLMAIEGLGSINIICTDKTGTLTQGKMTVASVWHDGKLMTSDEFKSSAKKEYPSKILDAMVLANTASLTPLFDHGGYEVLGDSTEGSLLGFAKLCGIDYELHRQQGRLLDEFGFDQQRKSMSVVWDTGKQSEALVKSSPEFMIAHSDHAILDGRPKHLSEQDKLELINEYRLLSAQGFRVLAFGYKSLAKKDEYLRDEVESNLVFLGLAVIMDPLRPEVAESLLAAKRAGIRTVMITGDNELTAMHIAKQLDLANEGQTVILGQDLEKMGDEELNKIIATVSVFARTTPQDKLRIVRAFQSWGFNVAVTGDGINDSLALKQAEIGIAMGMKGTDVAKEAADIVITDDNYATIVAAVAEGRMIYDSVKKAIRYLISTNISEIITIFFALILQLPAPLIPVQILWINLVSDSLPAIALAMDGQDQAVMSRMPRSHSQKLLDSRSLTLLMAIGLIVAIITLIVYAAIYKASGNLDLARTYAFTLLVTLQMIVAFYFQGFRVSNPKLVMAVVITLVIQAVIVGVPALHPLFGLAKIW